MCDGAAIYEMTDEACSHRINWWPAFLSIEVCWQMSSKDIFRFNYYQMTWGLGVNKNCTKRLFVDSDFGGICDGKQRKQKWHQTIFWSVTQVLQKKWEKNIYFLKYCSFGRRKPLLKVSDFFDLSSLIRYRCLANQKLHSPEISFLKKYKK